MSPVLQVLNMAREAGVQLRADGEKLKYEAPSGALTPELRGVLKQHKTELIDFLREAQASLDTLPPPKPVPDADVLSHAQRRMWFLEQLEGAGAANNVAAAFRLDGVLDYQALKNAFGQIIERHEILRTSFLDVEGEPKLNVHRSQPVNIPLIDLSGANRREDITAELAQAHADKPFDLISGRPIRFLLIRTELKSHILAMAMHHIVSDGWSIRVMIAELAVLYRHLQGCTPMAACTGVLPPLDIQYKDYAHWQAQVLNDSVYMRQRKWWADRLEGAPNLLELPADRPRPDLQSHRGAAHAFVIPRSIADAVRSTGGDATLFMKFQTVYALLLSRYTDKTDISIGAPIASRTRRELETLIGFFANTVVYRLDLTGNPSISEMLARTRQTVLDTDARQDLPFDLVVEAARAPRELSHTPLFQTMFLMRENISDKIDLAGLAVTRLEMPVTQAQFDLTLELEDTGTDILGSFIYATELFNQERIARMAEHFIRLTDAFAKRGDAAARHLAMLSDAEHHLLLDQWNPQEGANPAEDHYHPQFEQLAHLHPDKIALIGSDGTAVSYGLLNRRANRLAHYIQSKHVGLVGVYLERDPAMIIVMLATQKAGAAYVPLDPAYPEDRVRYILDDANAALLITQDSLSFHGERDTLCLDNTGAFDEADYWPATNPEPGANDLSHVIYTSGSTGLPKGVAIRRKSVSALIDWSKDVFSDDDIKCVLAATSICFDLSVFEIFLPLCRGGSVQLADNVLQLPELSGSVSLINTVPSAMAELIRLDAAPAGIRVVNLAGEPLHRSLADHIHAASSAELFNLYGPSEDTTYSTWALIGREDQHPPVIGRPLKRTQAYVIDSQIELTPPGIKGDLVLAGEGLARGYLHKPALTAEKFTPNPFGNPGSRLYHTGDLAHHLPDGNLMFDGRLDHQIKLRGFRIELGEIEARLKQHDLVEDAVAGVFELEEGDNRLVAFVESSQTDFDADLVSFLEAKLPEYMTPSLFQFMSELPRTPNGKADRKALKPDMGAFSSAGDKGVAPRNETERAIFEIWARVLGHPVEDIHASFFDQGGHSLLATRVAAALRKTFEVELALRTLFKATTIATQAEQIRISSGKRDHLPPITARDADETVPLSFSQERLWFLEKLEPDSAAYHIPALIEMRGELDVEALHRALNRLVKRHESLRTRFTERQGQPIQEVVSELDAGWELLDWTSLDSQSSDAKMAELLRYTQSESFDLEHGPLLRFVVIQQALDHWNLVVVMHHIISDGWSLGVLIDEMSAFYALETGGDVAELEPLKLQFADYAIWQRDNASSGKLDGQRDYWRKHLDGAPALLELPTQNPRPLKQTYDGALLGFDLDPTKLEELNHLAREQGATLFMALHAAWAVLLSRYSRQCDVVIGVPVAQRTRAELEPLIGFFVNTIAPRLSLKDDPDFKAFLSQTARVDLDAFSNQDLPFEHLVEILQPERGMGYSPIFQVMFVYQNTPEIHLELPGLHLKQLPFETTSAKVDLTLTIEPESKRATLEYNTQLFSADAMTRMAEHFSNLIDAIIRHPQRPVSQLPLLGAFEREKVTRIWNETAFDYPGDRCMHLLFEDQVTRTPDGIALVSECENQTLTYDQLNRRANQLAKRLVKEGVAPETPVGVHLSRSVDMVVSLLAILKAGGFYVPLDPELPSERIDYMIRDAGVEIIISDSGLQAMDVVVIEVADSDGLPDHNISVETNSNHAMYMIYTSGSTGRPKGVINAHRPVVNRVCWGQNTFDIAVGHKIIQKTPFSFDVSVWEIFWPLLNGASLILAEPGRHGEPHYLSQLINRHQVTHIHFVPGMLDAFLAEPEALECGSLQKVFCSGEALSRETQRKFQQHFQAELHNLYGPTEAAIEVTWKQCHRDDSLSLIGKPIGNVAVQILDSHGEPVPTGVAGILHLGDVCPARGYHNRPSLTAQHFVPDPYSSQLGARLYNSGDLARYLEDGSVAYLGRVDHQVKLRGFRIELGEIEAALEQHRSVATAVAMIRDDRLVAYLRGDGVDPETLKEHLTPFLPAYMIPSVFVEVAQFPSTSSGKINRKALAAMPLELEQTPRELVAPRNQNERRLMQIWRDLLGTNELGVTCNFFERGGHSLLAARLASSIREHLHLDIPLHVIFEKPTIAQLADRVDQSAQSEIPAITVVDRNGSLPLSFIQRRMWFLARLSSGAYHMPAAIAIRGWLNPAQLRHAVNGLSKRHEALRTTFPEIDGEPIQKIHPSLEPQWRFIDGLLLDEKDIQELIRQETAREFNITHGPLLRFVLIKRDAESHVLLLTLHHLIADGWSVGLLIRELSTLYSGKDLAPLRIQYADYAVWQQERNTRFDRQREFWRDRLLDAPDLLELPTDHARPTRQTFNGAQRHFRIPVQSFTALEALAGKHSATTFMALHAVFSILLSRYSRQNDIVIGAPVANRPVADLEPLIGCFVNTVPLRLSLKDDPSFIALLERATAADIAAFENQDLPFEQIVDIVQPARDMRYSPIFQVMLVLQNTPDATIEIPGLTLTRLPEAGTTAKTDLTLTIMGEEAVFEYNTDLFSPDAMLRMSEHFAQLLTSAVANPSIPISQLAMLDPVEREHVLTTWNQTTKNYQDHTCIHHLFEKQVEANPSATALVYDEPGGVIEMHYGQLNQKANQLAHYLQSQGVGPETCVGVYLERSLDMVVSLYAILKAGGYYLPLDPSNPPERTTVMLEDARPMVVISHSELNAPKDALSLDQLDLECMPTENPPHITGPQHAMYMIYTSGSTGRPKGVVNRHQGLANRIGWMQRMFSLTSEDCVVQKTPFSFDVSVWEFFWPLLYGARLAIAQPGKHGDPFYLSGLIKRHNVTTMHFVPGMLDAFLADPGAATCNGLRQVFCSGEALSRETQRRFQDLLSADLHNLYGPTEAAIDVTWHPCSPEDVITPIGKAIDNTQIYILDSVGQPVPMGIPGLLHIAGVNLARGYFGRPSLTAQRFLPNPFSDEPGARFYDSGDLARNKQDGSIEYLGRVDHQIKLRGFRIELGEIEAALEQCETVRAAVVLIHQDQLAAFIRPNGDWSAEGLSGELGRSLPSYMVPTVFHALGSFPVTGNGKVDRRALAGIAVELKPDTNIKVIKPRNPIEEKLAAIWSDILGVEEIGVNQDFFALGGHSLLATRVAAAIRKSFHVDLDLAELFAAPTIIALSGLIEETQQKEASDLPELTAVSRDQELELSWTQQRMWFLERFEPGGSAYHIPVVLDIHGELDLGNLRRSIGAISKRHEALRTTFPEVNGRPIQRIHDQLPQWVCIDLRGSNHQQIELQSIQQAESSRVFSLETGPLWRVVLIMLDHEHHQFLLNMHHMISDGWSLGLFIKELGALYRGQSLEPLEIQYADYAAWQRSLDHQLENQRMYWRKQLEGAPALLELPLEQTRPARQTFDGAEVRFELNADQLEALQKLAQTHGATLFMGLHAIFAMLLARYSRQQDIVIGAPVAGRAHAALEPLIGCFVNTLALRVSLDGDPGFTELLSRVRTTDMEAFSNQDLPFEQLVDLIQPQRDMRFSPVFQVMMVLQNTPLEDIEMPGLSLKPTPLASTVSKFDLTLNIHGAKATLEYNTHLFDTSFIQRMSVHFKQLLAAAIVDPEIPVSHLDMLDQSERDFLITHWNQTDASFDDQICIHHLFEQQVSKTPQAKAVVFDHPESAQQLSYDELNRNANQLAHLLKERGVGPESCVGVFLDRSLEMVISLYAVLKAGGYYLPLDPGNPSERLAFMLADADPDVVISHSRLDAPDGALLLDRLSLETMSSENPKHRTGPDHAMYMIYTSGSTGRPKGVINYHRSLSNRIGWMQRAFALSNADHVAQKTPFSFDVSVWEFFWPLLYGARLVVAQPERHGDPFYLAGLINRFEITTLHFVPGMLDAFLADESSNTCPSLRQVFCSGEALSRETQRRFQERLPAALHNLYGPTEAAIDVTWRPCSPEDEYTPIGKPIENTQIHILDATGEPTPVNVPGLLHIAGVNLARCYHNRPALTAQRFLPNPFSGKPGDRMYDSGDLARYRKDGQIEYLGRTDHQVKLRGFRIELGEIETALERHESVLTAVALILHERIVAFLRTDSELESSVLRGFLAPFLPEFMIPSIFQTMEDFPVTPNGKIDRRALASVSIDHADPAETQFVAPRNDLEHKLAAIWSEVLGVERPGVFQDFFESGGHSLLATKLVSRIRAVFGVDLPVRAVFENASIHKLAVLCSQDIHLPQIPPMKQLARTDQPLPLSFAQQRMWFFEQFEDAGSTYNMPAHLLLRGPLDMPELFASLKQMVDRHENLRASFPEIHGKPGLVIHPIEVFEPRFEDVSHADDPIAKAKIMAEQEINTPFNVKTGPLMRVLLVKIDDQNHALVVNMHHIITDGWSLGVMVRELAALYAGETLEPLPIQYADYAGWQQEHLNGDLLSGQLDWWRDHLEGAPALLQMPLDHPRPATRTYDGDSYRFTVDAELTEAINQLSRHAGASLFMTLMSVYAILLSRYSGQDDVLIGSPVAGRNRPEIEPLLGLFVNILVFRCDLSDNPLFKDVLARVRHTALETYRHQDAPFEAVVEAVQPERDLSHSPLFQAMFVLQNAAPDQAEFPGLSLEPFRLAERKVAPFELNLVVHETAGELSCRIEYNTDLFDEATIHRMASHYQNLLQAIVTNADECMHQLSFISEREIEDLRALANQTPASYSLDLPVHKLFEQYVSHNGEAVALLDAKDRSWSYAELDTRANGLASALSQAGVKPEQRVGVCLARSLETVAAMFGVFKVGATLVMLDPELPRKRLDFIREDASIEIIITDQLHAEGLDNFNGTLIQVEATEPLTDWVSQSDMDHAAYMIYTSGTTGKPKAVVISHRAFANTLLGNQAVYRFAPGDMMPCASVFYFDISFFELFNPLVAGASCMLLTRENIMDMDGMTRIINQSTCLQTVLSVMDQIVRHAKSQKLVYPNIRLVFTGGDRVPPQVLAGMSEVFPNADAEVIYGPTEATIVCTRYVAGDGVEEGNPIGKPYPGFVLHPVDANLNPVPRGVAGELLIGGPGVALGYHNRDELTQEKFIEFRFPGEEPARFYRSGDLVRYRTDGNLEFLGRIDHQVKIRGFRVELGEIQAALLRHEQVSGAEVLATGELNRKQLVAFVTGKSTDIDLRAWLGQSLPEYMIPTTIAALDEMPLTANGKVNRKELTRRAAGVIGSVTAQVAFAEPQSRIEQQLATIWAAALGVEKVGIDHNFFDLGGHSMLMVQVHGDIKKQINPDLTLVTLFQHPTIRSLASALRQSKANHAQNTRTLSKRAAKATTHSNEQRNRRLQRRNRGK